MSQSRKGEFMDFFTEAVDVLAAIVRALSRSDSPEDYFGDGWQEMLPVKAREAVLLPVRLSRLWPPIRAEPGKGRAETDKEIKQQNKRERIREQDSRKY